VGASALTPLTLLFVFVFIHAEAAAGEKARKN
jgi:hypothetical protein